MFERLINWFTTRDDDEPVGRASALNRSGAFNVARPGGTKPAAVRPADPKPRQTSEGRVRTGLDGEIEDLGPGKNVLVRHPNPHGDPGSQETLSLVDDSLVETNDEAGIDPYNTGKFDRSRNWDKRFR